MSKYVNYLIAHFLILKHLINPCAQVSKNGINNLKNCANNKIRQSNMIFMIKNIGENKMKQKYIQLIDYEYFKN
jgi:hypothetical protein